MKLFRKHRIEPFVIAVGLAGMAAFVSCSSDETVSPPPPPTPRIDTVSKSLASPGDTLLLTGANFATPSINNTVYFNNAVGGAKPFRSTGDSLEVEVPGNANSGGVYVTSLGVRSNAVVLEVQRAIGEPWIVGQGTSFDLKLPTPTGSERYLVAAHPAQPSAVLSYVYTVSPDTTSVFPVGQPSVAAEPTLTLRERFEAFRWDDHDAYMASNPSRRPFTRPIATAAPPGMKTFLVLKCQCSSTNPSNFAQVTAELVYNGTHALIYADLNQPTGSYTAMDYQNFGQLFDTQIFPVDTAAFGPPTDIDNNDRVIILFSPVVNQITTPVPPATWRSGFISGFFLPNDLAPNRYPAATSNSGEIFYAIVPDPNDEYGNDFDRSTLLSVIPGTLAHEFEHMISYGYRYWTLGGGSTGGFIQTRWFEEGMAHIAEDLNGFDGQNIARANLYINSLSQKSVFEGDDSLEQRGGIFLFLRYLGDRYGEAIYRDLVETACTGQGCTLAVLGEDFFLLFGDFLATMYLSNRGITSDPRYNYTSFDFQSVFDPIPTTTRDFGDGMFSGSVRNGAGQYWLLQNGTSPAAQLHVSASKGSLMRLLIVRLQ